MVLSVHVVVVVVEKTNLCCHCLPRPLLFQFQFFASNFDLKNTIYFNWTSEKVLNLKICTAKGCSKCHYFSESLIFFFYKIKEILTLITTTSESRARFWILKVIDVHKFDCTLIYCLSKHSNFK
jgi:hypothetical protein